MSIMFSDIFPITYGGVAQLGEHLPCKQGVKSSILFISTMDCKVQRTMKTKYDISKISNTNAIRREDKESF